MASLQREKRKMCRQGFDSSKVWACKDHDELEQLRKKKEEKTEV